MENVPVPTNPAVAPMPLPTTPIAVMQSNVSSQPIMKQLGFLLAIAASIAIGGYVLMWSMSPNYQVLFSGMQPKESSEVVSILQQSLSERLGLRPSNFVTAVVKIDAMNRT